MVRRARRAPRSAPGPAGDRRGARGRPRRRRLRPADPRAPGRPSAAAGPRQLRAGGGRCGAGRPVAGRRGRRTGAGDQPRPVAGVRRAGPSARSPRRRGRAGPVRGARVSGRSPVRRIPSRADQPDLRGTRPAAPGDRARRCPGGGDDAGRALGAARGTAGPRLRRTTRTVGPATGAARDRGVERRSAVGRGGASVRPPGRVRGRLPGGRGRRDRRGVAGDAE